MFLSALVLVLSSVSAVAQSTPAVVCVAGQCLQGFSDVTIGTKLSAPGVAASVQLLPGQYTSATSPEILQQFLASSSASLSPSPGFGNSSSSLTLPLNVALQPGFVVYPQKLYSGTGSFTSSPNAPSTNFSAPVAGGSLALSTGVWVSMSSGNNRIILWDSIPDMLQLPSTVGANALSVSDVQSFSCSPACSGSGVCLASGTCACPTGFAGTSCESCARGFFGPSCQPCPAGCVQCDEGISGGGRCLKSTVTGALETCNCLNGVCGSDGQCTCNSGWTTSENGSSCAKCTAGFFLTASGDCQVCQQGCVECENNTGTCVVCKEGFIRDANDKSKCNALPSANSAGIPCPEGTFGQACTSCSSSCRSCSGPTPNDCIVCQPGTYSLNGRCVGADANGLCQGTNDLIADNSKLQCDTCGSKCTACRIPNFSSRSTADQVECTRCLPGSVLFQGKCIAGCPSGTFLSSDNLTCASCASSCGTCAGAADFCLTCKDNQLASAGKCVSSCPTDSFSTPNANTCTPCHPDCASCSGSAFNQCSSCPQERPVLTNGRCLPTCTKSQFFDKASSTCQGCDPGCSSCSGPGASNCLACSSATQVLKGGLCTDANCNGSSNVVAGFGVCLSQLVSTSSGSGDLPPIKFGSPPNARRPLEWWQILLMALGCAFILLVLLLFWRRHARNKRAKRTAMFASARSLDRKGWRGRFADWLFGHGPTAGATGTNVGLGAAPGDGGELIKLAQLREQEEERHHREIEKLLDAYEYSGAGTSRGPSPHPSLSDGDDRRHSRLSAPSLYSQITGASRRLPEPRQPVRKATAEASRFSMSTFASSTYTTRREIRRKTPPPMPTDAEAYAEAHRPLDREPSSDLISMNLSSNDHGNGKNPFRK